MDTTIDALAVRPLEPRDLDDVVAIDAAIEGHPRRIYFETRLAAARRQPAQHAQFAVLDDEGRLAGHLLARVLEGEFGYTEPRLRLEAVGVRPGARRSGAGRRLFAALVDAARQRDIDEVHTLASWRDHAMLQWLDALGFALAPAQVLDCAVAGGAYAPERDDTLDAAPEPGPEIDYGASAVAGNDFERLARDVADVRTMAAADLPEIVRVDRDIVGRPRERYMRHLLEEALADSSLRISLTAHAEGALAGYLMARADRGDFGRTEPVVVLDTLGVAPGYAGRGIGHALISQLFVNLGALRIERVETVVAPRDFALLGFLQDVGFAPSSQRLAFRYRIRRPQ